METKQRSCIWGRGDGAVQRREKNDTIEERMSASTATMDTITFKR